jgi:pimeloyl-ACP methyl ester carboxylesterase
MMDYTSKSANVDFAVKWHLGATNRPLIVFVHSDAGNKEQFDSASDHARNAGWSVCALDRRGHGKSSMPKDGMFGYAAESSDIFTIADDAGFERIILVGHSGGGAIAFKAANEHPERVAGLMLVDPALDPTVIPSEQILQTLASLRKDFRVTMTRYFSAIAGPNLALADRIVATALKTPPATIIGITENQLDFRPRDNAGRFAGPAHSVIQPEFDTDGALHRLQPSITHEIIGGAGHWIHMAEPKKFEASLDRFLKRVT